MRQWFWFILVVLLLFLGCVQEGGKESVTPTTTAPSKPDPVSTIESFVKYYNERKPKELYELLSKNVRAQHPIEEVESQLEVAKSFGVKITEWSVLEKKVEGDKAILRVRMISYMAGKEYDETFDFSMVFENGKWAIDTWIWKS